MSSSPAEHPRDLRAFSMGLPMAVCIERRYCDHTGPILACPDYEVAAELLQAGPHACNTDAEPDWPIGPDRTYDPMPVVADANDQVPRHNTRVHRHLRSISILCPPHQPCTARER